MHPRTAGVIVVLAALVGTACQSETQQAQGSAEPIEQTQAAPTTVPVATVEPASPAATIELIEQYATQAQALSTQLAAETDAAAAISASETLLDLGAQIVPAFVERHPHCREYLEAAMTVQTRWQQMDAATLERDFHKDGALPAVTGDSKTCYHMKDLVVHPATALVLLSQSSPDFATARKEITEVVAHAHVVKAG